VDQCDKNITLFNKFNTPKEVFIEMRVITFF